MPELPYQTWERIKGTKWPGGTSPEVVALLKQYGITSQPGFAETNLALQKALLGEGLPTIAPSPIVPPAPVGITGREPITPPLAPPVAPLEAPPISPTPTREDILSQLAEATRQKSYQAYLDFLAGQTPAIDIYKQYREELGLPAKEEVATGIQTQIQKTSDMLDALERNINERISGRLVTEPLRQRMLAVERRPLTEELSRLMTGYGRIEEGMVGARGRLTEMVRLAQSEQERQAELAKAKLEYGLARTPQEELALEISKKRALKKEFPEYQEVQGGLYDITNKTWIIPPKEGAVFTDIEKRKLQAIKIDWRTPEGYQKALEYLYLPEPEKSFLTSIDYKALSLKGVPKEVADAIAISLSEGITLEQIRLGLAAIYGREKGYGYLDIIIPYLQESVKKTKASASFWEALKEAAMKMEEEGG